MVPKTLRVQKLSELLHIMVILGLKQHFMVLDVCVKFGVMYDFGSQDMGSNGVRNRVF